MLSDPAIYEFENAPPVSEEWLTRRYEALERRSSLTVKSSGSIGSFVFQAASSRAMFRPPCLRRRPARVAYVLGSAVLRQRHREVALSAATLAELRSEYRVHTFAAVLKAGNFRWSSGLRRKLQFRPAASAQQAAELGGAPDEPAMVWGVTARGFGRPTMKVAACQSGEIRNDVSRAMASI